jgi:hypothetical protein
MGYMASYWPIAQHNVSHKLLSIVFCEPNLQVALIIEDYLHHRLSINFTLIGLPGRIMAVNRLLNGVASIILSFSAVQRGYNCSTTL